MMYNVRLNAFCNEAFTYAEHAHKTIYRATCGIMPVYSVYDVKKNMQCNVPTILT